MQNDKLKYANFIEKQNCFMDLTELELETKGLGIKYN